MIVWKPSLAANPGSGRPASVQRRIMPSNSGETRFAASPMMVGIRSIPARSSLRHLRSSTDEMPSENSSMLIMASRM